MNVVDCLLALYNIQILTWRQCKYTAQNIHTYTLLIHNSIKKPTAFVFDLFRMMLPCMFILRLQTMFASFFVFLVFCFWSQRTVFETSVFEIG